MQVDLAHAEMFFLDLDGTLLRSDGTVSPRTSDVLGRLAASGRQVVLATGRPVRQIESFAAALGHRGHSICSNGAAIYAHDRGEIVASTPFAPRAAATTCAVVRHLVPDARLSAETPSGLLTGIEQAEVAGDWLEILVHGPRGVDDDLLDLVRSSLAGIAEVSRGTPSGPLELTAAGVDKGTTALSLAALSGVGREALVAFGDMPNDLPLLTKVGYPHAMANAHPRVLTTIVGRAPANDEDGVATVLEPLVRPAVLRAHVRERHRFSFAVAAHPDRLAAVLALRARHPDLHLDIVLDPRPDGPPMAMRTARLAWRSVPPWASHRVVLQDDVTLAPGFLDAVRAVTLAAPDDAVSLFAEWGSRAAGAIRLAALLGHDFAAVANNYVPTQALVLPAEVARGFDAYAGRFEPDTREDDLAMARYLEKHDVRARLSVPNLVEHDDGVSLVGNSFMGVRRATCFAGGGVVGHVFDSAVFTPWLVPFFCGRSESACCLLLAGPRRQDWHTVPAGQALRRMGLGGRAVGEGLRAAVRRHPHRHALRSLVAPAHLGEAWLTAYALGVGLADHAADATAAPGDVLGAALARPWAAAALSTMAAGALRSFAPSDVFPHVQDVLLVALRQGFTHRAAGAFGLSERRQGA